MMRRTMYRLMIAATLAVLAACGDGRPILQAGNDQAPTTPATLPAATVPPITAAPGETLPPTTPAPTIPAPTTTTTPLSALPACPVEALAAASGPVDLTFWHGMKGGLEDALVKLTDEYNASQAKVRVTLQNQGGYEQAIDKYVQSSEGSRPDILQTPEYSVQQMRDTKSFVPMGACMQAADMDTSDFLGRALTAYSTEGVQWSMPFNVSNPVLYYNRKVFEKAGLDPDSSPLSLEDLRAVSQAVVTSGGAGTGIGLDTGFDGGGGWYIEQWFSKLGELYTDNGNGRLAPATKVFIDNPKAVELMTFLQQMINDGLAFNVGDDPSGQGVFLKMADSTSPSAMTIGTSAALGTVISVLDGGLIPGLTGADIGVGPMPGPGGAPGVLVGGASLWIVDGHGDEKTAASWDYINYLVSAQSQSTWAAATGYVPVRAGALDLDPLKTTYATDPRFKVAYDQVNAPSDALSAAGPITGPLKQIRVVVARAVATILQGGDPQATLAQAALDANALIADYTSRNS